MDQGLRFLVKIYLVTLLLALVSAPARAVSDDELIRGFNLTVFNTEFSGKFGSAYVKKFGGQVRFKIHNLSKINRLEEVRSFVRKINREIVGLDARMAHGANRPNFQVYIVDRADYEQTVRDKVFNGRKLQVPGKCIVRSRFNRGGILRSDAVIVSDLGDTLFRRCMVEEILQGLGPLNDHDSLNESVFNDTSKHSSFTKFDRSLLNILYDSRIRSGASTKKVNQILPVVVRDVQARSEN